MDLDTAMNFINLEWDRKDGPRSAQLAYFIPKTSAYLLPALNMNMSFCINAAWKYAHEFSCNSTEVGGAGVSNGFPIFIV